MSGPVGVTIFEFDGCEGNCLAADFTGWYQANSSWNFGVYRSAVNTQRETTTVLDCPPITFRIDGTLKGAFALMDKMSQEEPCFEEANMYICLSDKDSKDLVPQRKIKGLKCIITSVMMDGNGYSVTFDPESVELESETTTTEISPNNLTNG